MQLLATCINTVFFAYSICVHVMRGLCLGVEAIVEAIVVVFVHIRGTIMVLDSMPGNIYVSTYKIQGVHTLNRSFTVLNLNHR